VGLGLVGQLALQLLRANGCRVLALDLDAERVKLAQQQGADWAFRTGELPATWAVEATDGHGADLVLVAASASGAEPLELAARLCRHKGRIALVGNVPVQADRRLLYEKELELRMSTSYGPGRYDRSYEEHGLDYPIGYVRWTEQRNLQAFLQLVASGAVRPGSLAPEIVPFAEARQVYVDLGRGERRPLALVFRYDAEAPVERVLPAGRARPRVGARGVGVAFLGAGNYARGVLLPALGRVAGVRAEVLVASSGASARRSAERFGFARCGTDPELVLRDPEVDLVFVVTRHDSHAELARRALEAGKAVWLEKPAGIAPDEVEALVETAARTGGFLALGYNRRFSPHTRAIRDAFVGRVGPLALHYGVAAGPPPAGHWIADPRVGGGRIVGEVCHFVDLCSHLVGAPPATVYARALGRDAERDDSVVAVLGFGDGSTATLEYLAFAGEELPKERFEASGDRRTALCDNFRTTRISGARGVRGLRQDKGQAAALAEVLRAVREGAPSPFRLDEIAAVSRTTFAMLESVATGRVVALGS
jgi:predicted dehydrogenase